MSFELKGVDEVLNKLEEQLGERKRNRVVNQTLNDAGEEFKEKFAAGLATYRDTGASYNEVTRSRSSRRGGTFSLRVGLRGPMNRYALLHLNEFGYVRWGRRYSPRGMGVIRQVIDSEGQKYIVDVQRGLEELLR